MFTTLIVLLIVGFFVAFGLVAKKSFDRYQEINHPQCDCAGNDLGFHNSDCVYRIDPKTWQID